MSNFDLARVRIFELASPRVSQQDLFDLARRFGLAGSIAAGSLTQDATRATYREGPFELVVHAASGGLRFHDTTRWQVDDGTADVGFDDDTATAAARSIVGQYELAPMDEIRLLRVTRLNAGLADRETGYTEQRVIDVGVAFQRIVGGVAVEGPGGKVVVYLDHAGELTGADRLWRDISATVAEEVELRPAEAAKQDFAEQYPEAGNGSVTVGDIGFGYYEAGWDTTQRYLQPVYRLPLAITARGRIVMRSEFLTTAAVDSPEPLFPAGPTAPPQPPRRSPGFSTT